MKNEALGENYELELIFLEEAEMQIINREHHQKDKPTNILSFPLHKTSGQIFICLPYAKKEAPDFERNYSNYVGFLFIHGLIHLLGFDHTELTFRHAGRDFRLTDVHGEVVHDLIA